MDREPWLMTERAVKALDRGDLGPMLLSFAWNWLFIAPGFVMQRKDWRQAILGSLGTAVGFQALLIAWIKANQGRSYKGRPAALPSAAPAVDLVEGNWSAIGPVLLTMAGRAAIQLPGFRLSGYDWADSVKGAALNSLLSELSVLKRVARAKQRDRSTRGRRLACLPGVARLLHRSTAPGPRSSSPGH